MRLATPGLRVRRRRFITAVGAMPLVGGCSRLTGATTLPRFAYDNHAPIATVALGDDVVYLGGNSPSAPGRIAAISADTGDLRWDRATTVPGNALSLAVADETILVWNTADLSLAAFDGFGDTPWSRPNIESFPPPTHDGTAFLHRDTVIEAVGLADGQQHWERSSRSLSGFQDSPQPELVVGDHLVAATWGGALVGVDITTGRTRWQAFTRNIGPKLMPRPDAVLIGGEYRTAPVRLDRLDPTTGQLQTVHAFDTRHATPLQATGPLIVQTRGADGAVVYGLAVETGTIQWQVPGVTATVASTDAALVTGYNADTGRVVAIDAATGDRSWTVTPTAPDDDVAIAVTEDWVYVKGGAEVTVHDRSDGRRHHSIGFDGTAVGHHRLATTEDTAYLVVGDMCYRIDP